MKKIVLLLMASLLCVCSVNTGTSKPEPSKEDTYCSGGTDKGSACGIDENVDMSGYKDFRETKNQFVDLDIREALSVSQKKESAILYLGYLGCPWRVEASPVMNEVAKIDEQHILYVRIRDDKKKFLYIPKQKLEMISYTEQPIEEDDQDGYQLRVPFAVVVKDGGAVSGHAGAVDDHDTHGRKMTKKEA